MQLAFGRPTPRQPHTLEVVDVESLVSSAVEDLTVEVQKVVDGVAGDVVDILDPWLQHGDACRAEAGCSCTCGLEFAVRRARGTAQ